MYPKFFRSNPDDPRTEIEVHSAEAEAAVRETRIYPHEVVKGPSSEEAKPRRGRPPKADIGQELMEPEPLDPAPASDTEADAAPL